MYQKVRKPPMIKDWFGFETETSSEDTDENEWQEVDRKKRGEVKRKQKRKKRKEIEKMTATKAAHIVGIGPVNKGQLDKHLKEWITYG